MSPPLLHGHAISLDMCFSATLANQQGLLPNDQYMRFLDVLDLMKKGTSATIATRDRKLRAPVPTGTLGSHAILQTEDDDDELEATRASHKEVMKQQPRKGLGPDMNIAIRAEERVAQLQKSIGVSLSVYFLNS